MTLCNHLFVILISLVVYNVEESEFVDTLRSRDNSEPISQLLLLEELLCPRSQELLAASKISEEEITLTST